MQALAIPWLDEHTPLPATRGALGPDTEAPGLLAAGGQLSPARDIDRGDASDPRARHGAPAPGARGPSWEQPPESYE